MSRSDRTLISSFPTGNSIKIGIRRAISLVNQSITGEWRQTYPSTPWYWHIKTVKNCLLCGVPGNDTVQSHVVFFTNQPPTRKDGVVTQRIQMTIDSSQLLIRIREVPGSDLGSEAAYPAWRHFVAFNFVPTSLATLPCTSSLINYTLLVLSFRATHLQPTSYKVFGLRVSA